ncbi:MAG: sigma factor-like helix-turn-helix DNA-binding protein [Candidatus Dormibacteria bacterium]
MPLQPSADPVSRRRSQQVLLDRYRPLLTPAQAEVLGLHLEQDWSLAEIAAHRGTSRTAVHDAVRSALANLERCEAGIHAVEVEQRLRRRVRQLERRLASFGSA